MAYALTLQKEKKKESKQIEAPNLATLVSEFNKYTVNRIPSILSRFWFPYNKKEEKIGASFMATDGFTYYYDRETYETSIVKQYVEKFGKEASIKYLLVALLHELFHNVLGHPAKNVAEALENKRLYAFLSNYFEDTIINEEIKRYLHSLVTIKESDLEKLPLYLPNYKKAIESFREKVRELIEKGEKIDLDTLISETINISEVPEKFREDLKRILKEFVNIEVALSALNNFNVTLPNAIKFVKAIRELGERVITDEKDLQLFNKLLSDVEKDLLDYKDQGKVPVVDYLINRSYKAIMILFKYRENLKELLRKQPSHESPEGRRIPSKGGRGSRPKQEPDYGDIESVIDSLDLDEKEKQKIKSEVEKTKKEEELAKKQGRDSQEYRDREKEKQVDRNSEHVKKDYERIKETSQKVAGTEPGNIGEVVEKFNIGKGYIDWRSIIKRLFHKLVSLKSSYELSRPWKRTYTYRSIGIKVGVLYERIKPARKSIVFIGIDTSGSISLDEYQEFVTEIVNLWRNFRNDIKLIVDMWDVQPYNLDIEIEGSDTINTIIDKLRVIVGRGGTDIKPYLKKVQEYCSRNRIRPCSVIVFTDGYLSDKVTKKDREHIDNLICVLSRGGFDEYLKEACDIVIRIDDKYSS